MGDILGSIAAFCVAVVGSLGYTGLAILSAATGMLLPIPSQVYLPLAGFLIGRGEFGAVPVIFATTLGAVAGAMFLYALGRWVGEKTIRDFVVRYGSFIFLRESDLDQAFLWFDRHDRSALLVGRLTPGVGSLVSLPAGINRMPLPEFLLISAFGSAIWNGAFVAAGWFLGARWTAVEEAWPILQYPVLALLLCIVVALVWRRRRA